MVSGSSSKPLSRKGTMAPPSSITASATQSLYTSILAPPPAKRARTIHNPQDPPLPAAVKPKATPSRHTRSSNTSQTSQNKSKARKADKGKRKETASSKGKQAAHRVNSRGSFGSQGSIMDADVDMKAAATLTSLSRFRNVVTAAASSPRSSISASSDPGSLHSFAHFAQSSTRTTTAVASAIPSNEHSFAMPYVPTSTPPPLAGRTQSLSQQSDLRFQGSTTPKGQPRPLSNRTGDPSTPHPPSDTEAADLMLLFATSPSPIRPTPSKDRDTRDKAAYLTLSGGPTMPGRVLFSGSGLVQTEERSGGPRSLRRDLTGGSFSSTVTVATELASDSPPGSQERLIGIPVRPSPLKPLGDEHNDNRRLEVPEMPNVIPPTPTDQSPVQLLSTPLPRSPDRSGSRSPNHPEAMEDSADPKSTSPQAPPTPGSVAFNFHDFLNVSPSPAAVASTSKLSSNMRAEIGRKLFEEHPAVSGINREGVSTHDSSLGAGIDLKDR